MTNIERWGYPTPEPVHPVCPVCGDECNEYFVQDGSIIGCENCVDKTDAWSYEE